MGLIKNLLKSMSVSKHKDLYLKPVPLYVSFCLINILLLTDPVRAAGSDALFMSDDIIYMELRTDFSAIQKSRMEIPEYYDGELIYFGQDGKSTKLSVRVSARGNFRRDPANCAFPPLYVDFRNNEVKNTLFENQDKLKLVTPCQREKELIEEYIIYKMYNEVTDYSMRARLVKIRYFDTNTAELLFESFSFFLEDKSQIAERNNAVNRDRFITPADLNRDNFKRLAFFQYMTGNIDWYITSRKNILIMQPEDSSLKSIAVPYDFDLSGFVNPEYSKPRGVPAKLLKDKRVYRGLCYTDEEFSAVFRFYKSLRPRFESIINNADILNKTDRKQLLRYVSHFYAVIKRKDLIEREFLTVCHTSQYNNISEVFEPSK